MVDKLIIDGQVAVLVSHGYGSGWYSWEDREDMLFDPVIARALLDNIPEDQITAIAKQRYPDNYLGGLDGLTVHWVPVDMKFRITEYDGSEGLRLASDEHWIVA
jgi:hypothetical protein